MALKKNDWIKLETWESEDPKFIETALVLRHYDKLVKSTFGPDVSLVYLCGGDFFDSFSKPNLWLQDHVSA